MSQLATVSWYDQLPRRQTTNQATGTAEMVAQWLGFDYAVCKTPRYQTCASARLLRSMPLMHTLVSVRCHLAHIRQCVLVHAEVGRRQQLFGPRVVLRRVETDAGPRVRDGCTWLRGRTCLLMRVRRHIVAEVSSISECALETIAYGRPNPRGIFTVGAYMHGR